MTKEIITVSPDSHVTQEIAQNITYRLEPLQFYVIVAIAAVYLLTKLIRRKL